MTTIAETLPDITSRLDDGQGAPVAPPQDDTQDQAQDDTQDQTPDRTDPFAFLLAETDDDLLADFRAVGIDLEAPQSLDAVSRQAAASRLLRFAAQARQEAAKHEATRDAEVAMVELFYAAAISRATERARYCEAAVEALAELAREAGDFGKKKSAATPFGSFGYRETAEAPELVDAAALTLYAAQHAPEFVRASLTLPLVEARERFTDAELVERNALAIQWGEMKKTLDLDEALPPGVGVKPATRTFFAKPDVDALHAMPEGGR